MPRAVVLLTDGEVTNDDAVIELARPPRRLGPGLHHRHRPRPERALHQRRRPRERRRGRVHQAGERIEPKVLRQFARLGAPMVEDLRVEWNGEVVEDRAPYRQTQIFDGEPFLVYLRLPGLEAGHCCGWPVGSESAT